MKYEYGRHLEDIAIAQAALKTSLLTEVVRGSLLCDAYCIPSHNNQAFYLQVYGGAQYTLLYAKPRISDYYGNQIVMYPFRDAQKADRHPARRGDIFCGMKLVELDDPAIASLLTCLPSWDVAGDPRGMIIDGAMTLVRNFKTDSPAVLCFHTWDRIDNAPYNEAQRQFLDELYLHIESIIGNLLDSCHMRNPDEWLLVYLRRERERGKIC